jgi:hypothetical protein
LGDANDGLTPGTLLSRWASCRDSNADGFVNLATLQAQSLRATGRRDQFPSDVNNDGSINSGDTTLVRANSGKFSP